VQRRLDLADRARRGAGIEVGLVDDDQVGELHHALLDRLQVVAGVGQLQEQEHVGHAGNRGLALADADGLDDDDVVAGRLDDAHRLARRRRDAAERAAARARPHERGRVDREPLHARLVAEDRSARDARARVDASTATRSPSPMRSRPSVSMKVDLPTPGTPETPRRNDGRAGTGSAVRSASARSRWSARRDSSSVIALAIARRCASPRAPVTPASRSWSAGRSIAMPARLKPSPASA
jgi:hypothetical protein